MPQSNIENTYYCAGTHGSGEEEGRQGCYWGYLLCPLLQLQQGGLAVPFDEVKKRQKCHVKNPLPVCYNCLSLNVKLPGGGIDYSEKQTIAKMQRAILKEATVGRGRSKRHHGH